MKRGGKVIRTRVARLYPNASMKKVLDELCDYRRYCWNLGLETWNMMYEAHSLMPEDNPSPSARRVRDELVENKADWQFSLSARTLQLAIDDLGKAWQNFLNKSQKNWGRPMFKSKKAARQGFKTDRAKIVDGKLRLDKPLGVQFAWQDMRMDSSGMPEGELKTVSVFRENGKYYAALPIETTVAFKERTGRKTAVDVNVGHFDWTEERISVLPKRLKRIYERIRHGQRILAKKRNANGENAGQSKNYAKARTKLQRDYAKARQISHDIVQKFTARLVQGYDEIVIEDLCVKDMLMSHVASKGMHRSLFGYFRQVLAYKCQWYGKKLIVADSLYPSTQRCSVCGHIKTGEEKITLSGNKKHGTKHSEYVCYECGARMDRDRNAVMNLLALAN